MPRLMRLAWRIKEWVEPLFYGVILLTNHSRAYTAVRLIYPYEDDEDFTRTLSIPPEIRRTSVRHLCVNDSPRLMDQLLSSCTSVTDYWGHSPCAANLGSLPQLIRLATQLALVFIPHPIDFTHSLFSRITHLQVFNSLIPRDLAIWSGLAILPQLTHLAFSHMGYVDVFPELLRTCTALRVLVLVFLSGTPSHVPRVPEALACDLRFVCMVRKRRSGEVDPLRFYILEDASLHLP
ncbi:hypothetical protein FB45DRAFT_51213 [Roridomyces roridus]|uniref:F-box domain-containing protein n=1 Tax=Roridomyces roridus TaxID=1738132 RepID=A0AAD7AYK3_9AGAR|nr:hypothetical protein FB45DRAFT_51213 [Roridomyces roridus]